MNHGDNRDRSTHNNRHDGYQQRPQADDPIDQFHVSLPQAMVSANDLRQILVELTGIEPVASWLQTRRSPS
jgi:hypothetical protein